jgi:hypothetical protein
VIVVAMRLPVIAVATSLLLATTTASASPERPHCVGWAIGGAAAGLVVGYYAVVGGYALAGRSLLEGDWGAGEVAAVLTGEFVGMTLGPIAACRLSRDPRLVPAASFLIGGAILGGAAVGVPYFYATAHGFRPFGDEGDFPVGGALLGLALVTAGGVLGAWGGWALHRAREPAPETATAHWSVLPMFGGGFTGVGFAATM